MTYSVVSLRGEGSLWTKLISYHNNNFMHFNCSWNYAHFLLLPFLNVLNI